MIADESPVSVINLAEGIFEVTKQFVPVTASSSEVTMMQRHWEQWHRSFKPQGKMFISVGFFTDDFEEARKEDMRHTVFMLAVLLLLGFGGLGEQITPLELPSRFLPNTEEFVDKTA